MSMYADMNPNDEAKFMQHIFDAEMPVATINKWCLEGIDQSEYQIIIEQLEDAIKSLQAAKKIITRYK